MANEVFKGEEGVLVNTLCSMAYQRLFLKRFLLFFTLFFSVFLFLSGTVYAKGKINTLTDFSYKLVEEGYGKFLRLEFTFQKENLKYTIFSNPLKEKQLIINLENTDILRLATDFTLDGNLARYLTIRKKSRKMLEIMVAFKKTVKEQNFRIYEVQKDNKHTLVLEIEEPFVAQEKSFSTLLQDKDLKNRIIVIDPGHGGTDSGAIGPTGLMEKTVTLAVSLRLKELLEDVGAVPVLTREDDRDVHSQEATDKEELKARIDVANRLPHADVFLSVHCNAFTSRVANGTETFYHPKIKFSELLAKCLQKRLVLAGGLRDRGVSEANFYVLKHSYVPAALAELAFISNEREEHLLRQDFFQEALAMALFNGLKDYFANF